jgi:hypothetical protein
MKSRHVELLGAVSCAVSPDDREWAVISASGRKIKIPSTASSNKSCSAGVACLMAELRETMNGQVAFALQEGTGRLWHRVRDESGRSVFHPIASVEAEFGIAAAEHMGDLQDFVIHVLAQCGNAQLVLGVRFANLGFARTFDGPKASHTAKVMPGDPRFSMIWALDMSSIPYDPNRVARFRSQTARIVSDDAVCEMMSRVVAAPVCQPFPHGFAILSGVGGKGKGTLISAMAGLYGLLAAPFSLAALLGISKTSSTTNDQATKALITGLLAYDSEAADPGKGAVENLKKASAGEEMSMRLLQQNVTVAKATAFMVFATNHGDSLPSLPEWERRVWNVPYRDESTPEDVLRWRTYLGDGTREGDGIIDALMAGGISFALGRPDPKIAGQLTDGLTMFGRTLLDLLMTCGPLQSDGLPDRPRVWVKHPELLEIRASEREKGEQTARMGLDAASMRDIHATGGDTRTRQVFYIKNPAKFEPFGQMWRARQTANAREKQEDEQKKAVEIADVRRRLLESPPAYTATPGPHGQIELMRGIKAMGGWLLTPAENQWRGKGITAHWRDDASIRRNLLECDLAALPERYGLSLDESLLVIDCDAPKADNKEHGLDSLMRIQGATVDDVRTLAFRSQHGLHLVFRMPKSWIGRVKAATHVRGTQVDLRPGGKSYVVGPGSRWIDQEGEHIYPGIVSLPPSTLIEQAGEFSQREMRIPMLPDAIARWIESDPKCLEGAEQDKPARLATGSSGSRDGGHVDIPPMGSGKTHDPVCRTAMKAAGRAKNRGWPPQQIDAEMNRIRASVPSGHDPADTERCISSAMRKAGI